MISIACRQKITLRNDQGKVVYSETNDPSRFWYDKKRNRWCFKYRKAKSPKGFREGDINLVNILFLLTRWTTWA